VPFRLLPSCGIIATMRAVVELLGDWVEQRDVDQPHLLRVTCRAADGVRDALHAGQFVYFQHLLHETLWSAPGIGCFLLWREPQLWLARGTDAEWEPFCRPGLMQLRPPPMQPCLLVTRDALSERIQRSGCLVTYAFEERNLANRSRALCRIWTSVGAERRMWDRDGLFDLRDMI
jgi:hypothetical protein